MVLCACEGEVSECMSTYRYQVYLRVGGSVGTTTAGAFMRVHGRVCLKRGWISGSTRPSYTSIQAGLFF